MSSLDALLKSNVTGMKRARALAPVLAEWFDNEFIDLHRSMPQRGDGGILMGCPIWGDAYIRRMALYSLPTLGTDRNIEALSGRCSIIFYTEMAARPPIWAATRWLRQSGIHTVFRHLPPALVRLANSNSEDRYGLLATVENIVAHTAGHIGAGIHMYMADHLYGPAYFENLDRLSKQHEAIVQQGVSVNAATAILPIEKWRQESGALEIPDIELGRIARNHMHPRSSMFVMNRGHIPDRMPDSRQCSWIGRDAIHIADPCANLAWIGPRLCLDAPVEFSSTLDMLAPDYIPGDQFYMPTRDDGLAFFELSDASRVASQDYVGLDQFLLRYWAQVAFTEDYEPYMQRRSVMPIPEQADGLDDAEIERQHQWVLMALRSGKAQTMEAHASSQFPSRWPRAAAEPDPAVLMPMMREKAVAHG